MKWFKHFSDAYTNFKLRELLCTHGVEAYGLYWLCLELVAQQGKQFRIKKEKSWKKTIIFWTEMEEARVDELLDAFADLNLIDKKQLKMGVLSVPKMQEYSDEYTNKLRRMYGHGTDSVPLEQNRLDKNRIDKRRTPLTSRVYYLSQIPEEDVKYFTDRFQINEKALKSKAEDLKLWVEGRGRQTYYKNFKSVLMKAIKKDFGEREKRVPVTQEKKVEMSTEQKSEIQKTKDKISKKYSKVT